jgi:hypothetical protein
MKKGVSVFPVQYKIPIYLEINHPKMIKKIFLNYTLFVLCHIVRERNDIMLQICDEMKLLYVYQFMGPYFFFCVI